MDDPGPRGHEKTLTYPAVCDPRSCDCAAVGFRKEGTHVILNPPPYKAGTYIFPPADPHPDSDTHPCGESDC